MLAPKVLPSGQDGRVGTHLDLVGVIMAGGAGERMRRSGEPVPKPMVQVAGRPLVEHNLRALLKAGVRDVAVVVGASGEAAELVSAWAAVTGRDLVVSVGGRLELVVEAAPMGNAGALTLVGRSGVTLLLVFADNLTSLDLAHVAIAHSETAADLTLAVHDETFVLPYGVVDQVDGVVIGYREKPGVPVTVGSGIALVGPAAVAAMSAGTMPAGVIDLVLRSVDAGLLVLSYPHRAAWVDVNDAASRERAEVLVRADPDTFEL